MTYLTQCVPPEHEPLSLAEVKAHLRIDHDAEDGLIGGYIRTARMIVERWLGRALIKQSWQLILDRWPDGPIRLPIPPLLSVDDIRLLSWDGSPQSLDPTLYRIESRAEPGFILPVGRSRLPQPGQTTSGIEIDFSAGYGVSWNQVPEPVRQALSMMVGTYYEQREASAMPPTGAVARLLMPYRMVRL